MECKLFEMLSETEQQKLLHCAGAQERCYGDGQYIFRLGEENCYIYLVLEGTVKIVRDFASGRRNVLYTVTKGDIFGNPFSISEERNCWSDAVAEKSVRVLEIPWDFFFCFCPNACESHRRLVKNMLEILSDKNFRMTRKLYLMTGKTVRERIAMWVLVASQKKKRFRSEMKREELADFLGTTRPSLSRELMKMQEEGIFTIQKETFSILQRDVLEALAEQ